jgi:hypothetical protein
MELQGELLQSRFQLLPRPAASPGKCSVCGVVNREVIDFGLDIEFYGAVVICTECMISASARLNLVPVAEVLILREKLAHVSKAAQTVQSLFDDCVVDFIERTNRLESDIRNHFTSSNMDVNKTSEQDKSSDADNDTSSVGTSEQDNNVDSNERPNELSSSTSDGSSFNFH